MRASPSGPNSIRHRPELAQARANYAVTTRERLAKLDARINELEARGNAVARDAAIALRARRDALAAKLDTAASRLDEEWTEFRDDMEATFKKIEMDLDDAL